MVLSGIEIEKMYNYVKEHGLSKDYTLGNPIPCESNIGYRQYISTKGEKKKDIADYNRF